MKDFADVWTDDAVATPADITYHTPAGMGPAMSPEAPSSGREISSTPPLNTNVEYFLPRSSQGPEMFATLYDRNPMISKRN